jgi:hypothetical protein
MQVVPIGHTSPKSGDGSQKIAQPGAMIRHNSFPLCSWAAAMLATSLTGMVTMMCTATISTLTLTTMLQDPLIELVMRSDNVSEQDHSDLLYRVKELLLSRADVADACVPALA